MHKNPKEWQRPEEFLPDRFDPNSPLYLTPGGKKRHIMSFIPWGSGKRICLGKTLAESQLKILITYLTQKYGISMLDRKYPGLVLTHRGMTPSSATK